MGPHVDPDVGAGCGIDAQGGLGPAPVGRVLQAAGLLPGAFLSEDLGFDETVGDLGQGPLGEAVGDGQLGAGQGAVLHDIGNDGMRVFRPIKP